uniref:C2H2-type domain-containing protein n=1 Tax=Oncorhynchus mykiss TaxID=8022 RepID=A0A8K9Y4V7_ONCMY
MLIPKSLESGSKPGKPPSFEQQLCDEDFITQPSISPRDSVEHYPNSDRPEEPGTPRLSSTEVFNTEQHRPDEDSLELVMVKEEELDQTTNLAGPDQFVMDESDGQLWTSVDPGRDTNPDGHPDFSFHSTEKYSQNISIYPSHSGLSSVPTMTDEVGPSLHSSIGKPHANMFIAEKHSKGHVRTLADETRQQMPDGQSSEMLNSNNEGNSLALQSRQHQYRASEATVRLSECMTGTQWRSGGTTERRFSCTFCGKSFPRFWQLKEHLRSHTGEKPYTCEQCGRSFTKQCNLIRHAVVHSGEKPYKCTQCGKCFTQRSGMKSHQRTHIGEKASCSSTGLQSERHTIQLTSAAVRGPQWLREAGRRRPLSVTENSQSWC